MKNKCLLVILSVSALAADKPAFKPRPVAEYANKVTLDQVTIAIEPFDDDEKRATAFGKVPLGKFDVMPMLVVIENNRKNALDLKRVKITYRPRGSAEIDATPAVDVRFLDGPSRPSMGASPFPIPLPARVKKSKLNDPVIEERAFSAKMVAPGETASGFVYFWTSYHGQTTVTLTGLRDALAAQDLFFFEVPLSHR